MSEWINHQPCPDVLNCGSSDAYNYIPGQGGRCHSCGKSFKSTEEEAMTNTPPPKPNNYLSSLVVMDSYTEYRGVHPNVLKYYGVSDYCDSSGKAIGHVYPYPEGQKYRQHPKRFLADPLFKTDLLFGMDKFNAGHTGSCIITEGELDALSAAQMFNLKTPCVSLPSATPSDKLFSNPKVLDWLSAFTKIYCSFDSDGKSDAVLARLASMFPNRVFEMKHDVHKDANEFLTSGSKGSYVLSFQQASKYMPDNVWNGSEDFLGILRADGYGESLPTGIQALDDRLEGLMKGYLTVIQAPEGIGKTEVCRFIEYNILTNNPDTPIAIMHLEESNQRALLGLVSYRLGLNITRKSLIPDDLMPTVEAAVVELTNNGNLYLFNMAESDDPLGIIDKIRLLAVGHGVEYFFFEPIQDLAYSRVDNTTIEQFLSGLVTRLALLARELNISITTVAHENDDGAIRDCRMIGKRAGVTIKLARDKQSEDEVLRNTTVITIQKNRPTSYTGHGASVFFDAETFRLEEM